MLTLLGLGYLPGGATLASALALVVWLLMSWVAWPLKTVLLLFGGLLAIAAGGLMVHTPGDDPKEIVVDEFLGMYAALLFLPPADYRVASGLFIAFRAIDILKPPPFSWIDRWKAPIAILLDDIAIGVCLGLVYIFIVHATVILR